MGRLFRCTCEAIWYAAAKSNVGDGLKATIWLKNRLVRNLTEGQKKLTGETRARAASPGGFGQAKRPRPAGPRSRASV